MSDFVYILIIFLIAISGMGISIFYIRKETAKMRDAKQDEAAFGLIKQDLKEIRDEIKESREKNIESLQQQLRQSRLAAESQIKESSQIIKDVTERLTKLDETNKQVMGFAEQLQSLQDILKNPKQRGILGEYYLEELLKNVFSPSQYQMQYEFKNGDKVDAVIFVEDKLIPVDSKFSLENYNRLVEEKDPVRRAELEKTFKNDLKARIDETAKYIKPQEKTLDFALMFIPSEAIYYDLLINEVGAIKSNTRDLVEYASKDKKVHIISPNTFYAYLQTILRGLKAFQIQKSVIDVIKNVEKLGRHVKSYNEYMKKLGNHLSTTVNSYSSAYKEFSKIDKDVSRITQGDANIEPLQIDKPNLD